MRVRSFTRACATACVLAVVAVLGIGATCGSALAAPSVDALTIEELTGQEAQHVDGSTVWIRAGRTGSFAVHVDATTTAPATVTSVTFPGIADLGWTPQVDSDDTAAPFAQTYSWSAFAGAPLAAATVVVTDSADETATAPFLVRTDDAAPAGSVLVAQSAVTRDTSVPVSVVPGADAQSGIAGWRLQRRTATLGGGACTGWSGWAPIGPATPLEPITDALTTEGCYQYGAVVSDNVGNEEVLVQSGELRVDRGAPGATIDPVPADQVRGRGTVELTGIATDAKSGVRAVAVEVEDRYSICGNAPVDDAGRWRCTWNIDYAERVGAATIGVTVTDHAGNRARTAQDVFVNPAPNPLGPRDQDLDRTPPSVSLPSVSPVSWTNRLIVRPNARDDRGGYVEVRLERQVKRSHEAAFSPWRNADVESSDVDLGKRGDTTCLRASATDDMGNRAVSVPRCTTIPLDDSDLQRRGAWTRVPARMAWLGTLTRSTRRGAVMTVRTADPTPELVVAVCSTCGSLNVYHGKKLIGTYSTRSRLRMFRRVVQLRRIARPTSAPIRIVSASHQPVLIDAFISGT